MKNTRNNRVTSWAEMRAHGVERKLSLTLLLTLSILCGCAHQYIIKLNNGDQIISANRPVRQGSNYHFKDDSGMEHVIPRSRVKKIQSGSIVEEQAVPVAPERPKKARRWYYLWLA
jgi:hypothetical protein